jgi:capsular exopolysaccharide synthesis family protein
MDLKRWLTLLRRRWLTVVGTTVIGVIVAVAVAWTTTPSYTAHTKLFVSTASNQNDPQQAYSGGLFSQQRVVSYADIVSSPLVVSAVKQQLHLPESVRTLQGRISASAPLNTVLIDISVRDRHAARAQEIARAVAAQFQVVVDNLETTPSSGLSAVKVSVVSPAELPSSPSSPNKLLDLVIGVLAGLLVGIAAALTRDALDNGVYPTEIGEQLAGAPVLGSIPEDAQTHSQPLAVIGDGFSARSEAFRKLRTNIRFINVDRDLEAIVVTSAVCKEGKTTAAANLAVSLAQSGEKVILVDADLRQPRLAELFGLNPAVGLTNTLIDAQPLKDALQTWRPGLPLRVLTSGPVPPNPSELLGSRRMLDAISDLRAQADVIIFDTPPLLPVTDAAALAPLTDGAVLVCTPGKTKADHLTRARRSLDAVGASVLGVVLNRAAEPQASAVTREYGRYAGIRFAGSAPSPEPTIPEPARPRPRA